MRTPPMLKQSDWGPLLHMLEMHGFAPDRATGNDAGTRWYVREDIASGISTHIRIVFKQKLRVLAVHLGWNHSVARDFCLEAVKLDWPRGYAWLEDAGVLSAPCLSLFNLADQLKWCLGGRPISSMDAVSCNTRNSLSDWLQERSWSHSGPQALLGTYVADKAPFNWRGCNSALRLGQIAGLSMCLGRDAQDFDACAAMHISLIQADMFDLGLASEWISTLRVRMTEPKSDDVGTLASC